MTLVPLRSEAALPSTFDMLAPTIDLAERIASSEFVPKALQGRPEAVLACILYGHELGVPPMQALAEISVIEGRPAVSAQLMRARVLAHGHELWAEEASTTRVVLCGRRRDSDRKHTITWTMDDARKAGLAGRPNWQRYPRAMLEARATAELCRLAFPDCLGPARYVPEELEDGDAPPEAVYEAPASVERPVRRARRKPPPRTVEVEADVPAAPERPPLPGEDLGEPGPEPEPAPGFSTMSEPQRRKLFATLHDAGIDSREDRLRYCANIIGRPIESSDELTPGEGSAVIDAATELAAQLRPDHDDPAAG